MKKKFILAFLILILLLQTTVSAFAGISYFTFTSNNRGEIFFTQTGYVPVGIIDGYNIYEKGSDGKEYQVPLLQPEDIYIDSNDDLYIADSGNSRVVVFDDEGNLKKIIGKGVLGVPKGVFVDDQFNIYVADTMNEEVYKFDREGNLLKEYKKPISMLYGDKTPYKPTKVIVDKRGDLYITSDGTYQGLVHLSSDGDFMGFFGGNKLGFDLIWYLKKLFYTKDQKSRVEKRLPMSISNAAIDSEGLIYTCTAGLETEEIKKLNIAGKNLLQSKSYWIRFNNLADSSSSFIDLAVDNIGNIYAIDSVQATIYVFDRDGNTLFVFSGLDLGNQRLGLMKSPSGIAVSSDGRIYVTDKERNNIQVFKPTEFALLIKQAIALYLDGKYLKSEKPWHEILRQNNMFDLAHDGIGMVAMKKHDYQKAMNEFRISFNVKGFSNAYWEVRRQWMLKYFGVTLIIFIFLVIFYIFYKKKIRKTQRFLKLKEKVSSRIKNRIISEILFAKRLMRHPIDGYWELKREGKASVASATIILLIIIILRLFELYQTNFIFSEVNIRTLNILNEVYKIVLPLFAWIISNYLVSAINDGEGKFRHVYIGTIYALSPYLLLSLPIAIISKGLTLVEESVYSFLHNGMYVWCGILLFFKVKEIHNYELGETVKNIIYTIVGIIIIAIVLFILFGLSNQLWDFIYSLIQEVRIRD
ncbi:NHL repeat-containing protein [Caldicellulosiruptoraceae bacterium PP1]